MEPSANLSDGESTNEASASSPDARMTFLKGNEKTSFKLEIEIVNYAKSFSNHTAAKIYGISHSKVQGWLKDEEKIKAAVGTGNKGIEISFLPRYKILLLHTVFK